MSDNVTPIRPTVDVSQREKYIAWLQSVIDALRAGDDVPDALAIAVFAKHSDGTDVMCGGFRDDTAASKYMQAFIRNQGFAQPINDDEHEDV